MRYVSALKNSKFYNQLMKILILLMLLPPIMVVFVFWRLTKESGAESGTLPPEFLIIIIVMIMTSIIALFALRFILTRQNSITVEITDEGVNHLTPGKPRMYIWSEVRDAKIIKMGNNPGVVRLNMDQAHYTFYQYLTPDEPGAPQLSFSLGGMKWKHIDGTTVPVKIENTVGYQAVHRYVPDKIR